KVLFITMQHQKIVFKYSPSPQFWYKLDRIRSASNTRMSMSNAKIRLVICMGRTCNATGQAEPLYAELEKQLGEPSDFRCTKRVRWERANCLSHCGKGPNLAF